MSSFPNAAMPAVAKAEILPHRLLAYNNRFPASPATRRCPHAQIFRIHRPMTTSFDYDSIANHIEKRSELSNQLQLQLVELQSISGKRDEWHQHTRFAGEAEFWMQVHKALLIATAELPNKCGALMLSIDDPIARKKSLTQLSQLGGQLIHHAHTHHHVEDNHFFPVFQKAFPKLNHHLELLDGDHKVLTASLDQLELALREVSSAKNYSDSKSANSKCQFTCEQLLSAAKSVDALFTRHIADEEEICIPVILQI